MAEIEWAVETDVATGVSKLRGEKRTNGLRRGAVRAFTRNDLNTAYDPEASLLYWMDRIEQQLAPAPPGSHRKHR